VQQSIGKASQASMWIERKSYEGHVCCCLMPSAVKLVACAFPVNLLSLCSMRVAGVHCGSWQQKSRGRSDGCING
jgi:hypothetical protein